MSRLSAARLGAVASICCLAFGVGFAMGRNAPPSDADEKDFLVSYRAYLVKDYERAIKAKIVLKQQQQIVRLTKQMNQLAALSRDSLHREYYSDTASALLQAADDVADLAEMSNGVIDQLKSLLYDQAELIRRYGAWLEGEEDIHAGDP